MKYLFRLLALPFVFCLLQMTALRACLDFIKYGGEFTLYPKKVTIADLLNYIKEEKEKQP